MLEISSFILYRLVCIWAEIFCKNLWITWNCRSLQVECVRKAKKTPRTTTDKVLSRCEGHNCKCIYSSYSQQYPPSLLLIDITLMNHEWHSNLRHSFLGKTVITLEPWDIMLNKVVLSLSSCRSLMRLLIGNFRSVSLSYCQYSHYSHRKLKWSIQMWMRVQHHDAPTCNRDGRLSGKVNDSIKFSLKERNCQVYT